MSSLFQRIFIFGFVLTFCCITADDLSASRLWIIVTSVAYLDRTKASSIALSPPPTTATFLSLKNGATQGAQDETPRPINSLTPGTSSHLVSAPVAIIIDFAV